MKTEFIISGPYFWKENLSDLSTSVNKIVTLMWGWSCSETDIQMCLVIVSTVLGSSRYYPSIKNTEFRVLKALLWNVSKGVVRNWELARTHLDEMEENIAGVINVQRIVVKTNNVEIKTMFSILIIQYNILDIYNNIKYWSWWHDLLPNIYVYGSFFFQLYL